MSLGAKILLFFAGVLVVIALLFPIFVLIFQPQWLPNLRDTSIIYVSLFMCVGAILFIVTTALIGLIAFMIRDHIVPALEKADETIQTVRGTTTFVSESVVAPIIKVAGAAAGARAMIQTLMRRNPPKSDK